MIYALQFPAGFEDVAHAKLKADFNCEIMVQEPGFVLVKFNGASVSSFLKYAFFITNIDLVLNFGKYGSLEELTSNTVSKDLNNSLKSLAKINTGKSFQLRTFVNNQPSKLNPAERAQLLSLINNGTQFHYSAHRPQNIFNLKLRESGLGYFSINMSNDSRGYHKGEMHLSAASLLCIFGDIKEGDLILDAFAGYGGITKAALKFKPKKILAIEKDANLASALKSANLSSVDIKSMDIIDYLGQTDLKFNLILADPPWGNYDNLIDIENLYKNFLSLAKLKLEPGGRIVIVSSAKEVLDLAVKESELKAGYLDVLISGKKARVYCLENNF